MRRTLLVSIDVAWATSLAAAWATEGAVALVLLDGAVTAARAGHEHSAAVATLIEEGVHVAAHAEALHRHGLSTARLLPGVKVIDLDEVADLLADATDRALWT